jgi:serine/threonine protein kinase
VPQPAAASQNALAGRLLKQRYRIVKQVGSGGYGEVYRAIDTEFMDRKVAVKEMIQQGLNAAEVADASDSFKREAVLLATLTHPNLPSIYDYFSEHGNWYLVMSFIEGETLDSYIQQRGPVLPVEKVLPIAIQLATVLSFLHTRKPMIIFRDLKPANVMRTPEGQLYLIDFGIARHFKWGQTKDTLVLGSPGYAAPEQYGRAQTTPQTDVYSLGVLLHQLLTGLDPALTPFRHPKVDLPDYPQLSILLACMLEIDAKKRPASMGNIQRELQRISTGRVPNIHTGHHPARVRRHFFQASTLTPPQAPQIVSANLSLVPMLAPTFAASQLPGQKIWTKLKQRFSFS